MDIEIAYIPDDEGVLKATIPQRNKEWALAFIAKHSVKESVRIAEVVQEGHDEILDAIASLTDAQTKQKPSDDDWSALDAMAHVVTTKQVCAVLCGSLASGSRPPGIGPEWEEESVQDGITNVSFETLTAARRAAETAHQQLLGTISKLDSANLDMCFKHYIFAPMNAREWAVFQRIHDGDYIAQIRAMAEKLTRGQSPVLAGPP